MIFSDPIHVLIVEDNERFAFLLKHLLQELNCQEIAVASSYSEALQVFNSQAPDLCFIDVEIDPTPLQGIRLAKELRQLNKPTSIIFITAHYNEEVYEQCRRVRPDGFMNKELSRLKIYQAVELALWQKAAKAEPVGVPTLDAQVQQAPIPYFNNRNYFFKVGDLYKHIPIEEIAFFFAKGKMTFAKVEKRNFPTNVQLKTLENELFPTFIRTHKTFLVNISFIESINMKDGKVEIAGELIPIGYAYRKVFLDQLRLLK